MSSEIQEFYRGKSIFITGGTGLVGKLTIEKLLRSCTGINKIYVLCRSKKGKKITDRVTELLEDQLFDLVRQADPGFKNKIVQIEGDCSQINLGINEEDKTTLLNEVNIIFHCAATIRFNETLQTAALINVRGTRELLLLARGMTQLKALVYVSTILSNCLHSFIEEKLYEPPIDSDTFMSLVENIDEDTLKRITPGLLGKYPNTYIYTKGIAEGMLKQKSMGLPVGIVRPSLVLGTAKEPYPGWCDKMYANGGTTAAVYVGLLHNLQIIESNIASVIPADYTINASIVAAWDIAQIWDGRQNAERCYGMQERSANEIPVYNFTSFEERSPSWGFFIRSAVKICRTIPTMHALWIPFCVITESKYVNSICTYLFQIFPLTADILLYCTGRQPSQVKIYKKIHEMTAVARYFITRQWLCGTNNTRQLYQKLNKMDKVLFNFDMRTINWEEFMTTFVTGVRVYILKDPLTTVPQAKQKYRLLKLANLILITILALTLYKMFCYCFKFL